MDLDQLLDMSYEQLMTLMSCRARRRFSRGLKRKPLAFMKRWVCDERGDSGLLKLHVGLSILYRLRKAKKEAPPMEKPACVKTHMRNMIVLPEMIGSVIGVYNGKTFVQVEVKVGVAMCIALNC